jgi:hypothetical protein
MGWDHDEDAVTDAWEREPDHAEGCDTDDCENEGTHPWGDGRSFCAECFKAMQAAWSIDPSRCMEEGCLEEGTEAWEDAHYNAPFYYCKTHFADRADQEADRLADRRADHRPQGSAHQEGG